MNRCIVPRREDEHLSGYRIFIFFLCLGIAGVAVSCGSPDEVGEPSPLPSAQVIQDPSPEPSADASAGLAAVASPKASPANAVATPASSPAVQPTPAAEPSPIASPRPSPTPAIPVTEWDVGHPVFSVGTGFYPSAQTLRITAPFAQARVRYTIDGTEPGPQSGREYTQPVTIDKSTVVKALAYVPNGKRSEVVSAEFTVGELFVLQGGTGSGSRSQPLGSVAKAVSEAKRIGMPVLTIAGGTYTENVIVDAALQLRGGYAKDFTHRDATAFPTIIVAPEGAASTSDRPAFALQISGTGADADTLVEFITIRGNLASYSTALLVRDGAAPIIRNSRVEGSEGSTAYGARIVDAGLTRLESSFIAAGRGSTTIGLSTERSQVDVAYSIISAGEGSGTSSGVSGLSSRIRLYSSAVDGGTATFSYGIAMYAASNMEIVNCTVHGGTGGTTYGIFVSASKPSIRNVIVASLGTRNSYGIYENAPDSTPSLVEGFAVIGSKTAFYYDYESRGAFITVDTSGALTDRSGKVLDSPKVSKAVAAAFDLGARPELRTPGSAPAAVRTGAVIFDSPASVDRIGRERTGPWSLGAYELD